MTTHDPPREGLLLPDFALPRAGGDTVRARAYRGRRGLVLAFMHSTTCEACRAYLTSALDHYAAYAEEGAEVIVILPADVTAGEMLRRELALPFPVACDAGRGVFS
ncbi:MAG: peroxiredoxin family protein, partial [Dehalococcoidia bacterium]